MNNLVFSSAPFGGLKEPRKVYKPVFNKINRGEHPMESNFSEENYSWSKRKEPVFDGEERQNRLTRTIYTTMLLSGMIALIISLI